MIMKNLIKFHQVNFFLDNITKIIKLVDEQENDEIYDDEWLVYAQLGKSFA